MNGIMLDSSVYIDAFRRHDLSILSDRRVELDGQKMIIYLSAVVLAELYAGATDVRVKRLLAKLERDFDKTGRLLQPALGDWSICGQTLLSIGKKHGFEMIRRSRIMNDCLIALTARRLGLRVLTVNAKDFRMIAEFRQFDLIEI